MKSNTKPTMPTTEDLREALDALETIDEYAARLKSSIEDHLDEIEFCENSEEPEEVKRLESEGPEIHSDFDYLEGGLLDLKDKLGSLA